MAVNYNEGYAINTSNCLNRESGLSSTNSVSDSFLSNQRISEEALRVWSQLPTYIKFDSDLAAFHNEFLRKNGSTLNHHVMNLSDHQQAVPDPNTYDNNNKDLMEKISSCNKKMYPVFKYVQLFLLISCWLLIFIVLSTTNEKVQPVHQILVRNNQTKYIILTNETFSERVSVSIESTLLLEKNVNSKSKANGYLSVWLELFENENGSVKNYNFSEDMENVVDVWNIILLPLDDVDTFPNKKLTKTFELNKLTSTGPADHSVILFLRTNLDTTLPFTISYDLSLINTDDGIIYGAILLVGLYVLIIFEAVHSTIAAVLASTSALAVLAALNEKPPMKEIISWIDIDTLLLLFSMMILVTIIADTGIFDYLAVYAYKISSGKVWPLVTTLCFFTAFFSAFLDSVTIILLITPVIIRLCEVMRIKPVPILITMVIFSNIGGTMTPIGDPPNVIIASNENIINGGIHFSTFTAHMSVGILIALIVVYGHFRLIFRNLDQLYVDEPNDLKELEREITVWREAADNLASQEGDGNLVKEALMKKIDCLVTALKMKEYDSSRDPENYEIVLKELQQKYPIKKKFLLVKSGFAMGLAIVLFFLHSIPQFKLSLGWIAFICTLLLLLIAKKEDFEKSMAHVEWGTLLFFAALFVFMEVLTKLGIITFIGKQTETIIMSVGKESRLAVAILLLIWVSAIFGALFDNVPLTTMMIRIVLGLAENKDLGLPLQPLVWSMAAGMCLGGNGTLIGATANVVCAGVADQYGYKITFKQFFKMGFPVMMSSTLAITAYLMIAHVVFDWS